MIRGLNHLTLAVRDVDRSVGFYRDVPGFDVAKIWRNGAYLTAGALWLCLSKDPLTRAQPHPDNTHVAFDVAPEDFAAVSSRLRESGATIWKDNRSEGESVHSLDPDGHKLEIHVGSLQSRLAAMADRFSG